MFSSLLAPILAAAIAAAADPGTPGGPNLIAQGQPVARWIGDIRNLSRLVSFDPKDADRRFEESMKHLFGEKGFEGLDINRPLAMYGTLTEAPEKSTAVLIIPITGKDEFLEFLGRLEGKLQAEPVDGKAGLYSVTSGNAGPPPFPIFLRIVEQDAYFSLNDPEGASLDPAKLLPPAKLVDLGEQANVTIRAFPGQMPAKLLKDSLAKFEEFKKQFLRDVHPCGGEDEQPVFIYGVGGPEVMLMMPVLAILERHLDSILTDGKEVALRLNMAPTSELSADVSVTPKPGTKLAASIAAFAPAANPFAGLVPTNPAVAVAATLPFSVPEVRDSSLAILKLIEKDMARDLHPQGRLLFAELLEGIVRTIKSGDMHGAGGMTGPDEKGFCQVVGAIQYEDTQKLEKAARTWIATVPEFVKEKFTLDVDKVNGIALHTMKFPDAEFARLFSKEGRLCVALAPKAIHFAIGPDPVALVKQSLVPKPGPSRLVAVETNPKTLYRTIEKLEGPRDADMFKKLIGDDDQTTPIYTMTTTGGADFRLRFAFSPRFLPRAIGGSAPAPLKK